MPTLNFTDKGGYYDVEPSDLGSDVRRSIILTLEEMGFEIEASHHEVAPSQHEIDFKYADALTTADNVITLKWASKTIAAEYGMHATFMPKPIVGINGSGMHTNMSLSDANGNNVFYDSSKPDGISDIMRYFTAGLLKYVKEFSAITNPLVNSYKRLVPGYEAPVYIAWSQLNRSALIRVPASRGLSTRVELRCPDPAANPYLAFAVLLEAGLDGVINKTQPPAEVNENIYHLEMKTREERNINALPGDLNEAIVLMEQSSLCKKALGDHIYSHYIETKHKEYQDFRSSVSQWEIDHYLNHF